jgi:Amt family ammonium transporter
MVAITPCAGFVGPMQALLVGALAAFVCLLAVRVKLALRYDDSLDVLAVHAIGGVVGMVMLGLFASRAIDPAGANGLFEGGGWHFFSLELLAMVVSVCFSFGVSYAIAKVIDHGLTSSSRCRVRGFGASRARRNGARNGKFRSPFRRVNKGS